MKCTFIVQNNGCCLKWKRWKRKEIQLAIFKFCMCSLSQIFKGTSDNQEIKRLSAISLYMNKVKKYNCLYWKQDRGGA